MSEYTFSEYAPDEMRNELRDNAAADQKLIDEDGEYQETEDN